MDSNFHHSVPGLDSLEHHLRDGSEARCGSKHMARISPLFPANYFILIIIMPTADQYTQ